MKSPSERDAYVRVPLNPAGDTIVSVGRMGKKQVDNLVASGKMTPQ